MATDHFCLIWNNFQNSILSALGNLQTSQDLVDVTLMCEGQNVKAHKVILSACSPYFRNLFKEHPCQHPIIILKDVTHSDLTALLQFMYQGEVMVSQDNLASFLKTAELLQISGLTGSQQSSTNSNEIEANALPDTNLRKPPDIPETVTDRLSSEVSFKKQKRDRIEKEVVRENKSSFDTESDPLQSCSYDSSSPIVIKTESLDKDYDDMDTESGDISNADHYDNNSSLLEEPSILERSLKAQSDHVKEYTNVWKFYNRANDRATCLICFKILKCKGSSTTGLHRHLKGIHFMEKQNVNEPSRSEAPDSILPINLPNITPFLK